MNGSGEALLDAGGDGGIFRINVSFDLSLNILDSSYSTKSEFPQLYDRSFHPSEKGTVCCDDAYRKRDELFGEKAT